jgi:hypothetical protein
MSESMVAHAPSSSQAALQLAREYGRPSDSLSRISAGSPSCRRGHPHTGLPRSCVQSGSAVTRYTATALRKNRRAHRPRCCSLAAAVSVPLPRLPLTVFSPLSFLKSVTLVLIFLILPYLRVIMPQRVPSDGPAHV